MTTIQTRTNFNVDRTELSKLFERLPPAAVEAEMSLLGSMIIAGSTNVHIIGDVLQIVKGPDDFSRPAHGALYEILVNLYDNNLSLDSVQIVQALRDKNILQDVGGSDYIIQLAESVPIAENATHYARIVRDKSRLRQLIFATGKILQNAYSSSEKADIVIDKAEKEIFNISQQSSSNDPVALIDLVQKTYELLEKRHEEGRSITGTSTGFYQLDEILSGLQNGEMIIIAARPSMGKTALALNIAEYIAVDSKQPVALFSLEMGKQQLAERLMSSRSGVDGQRMRRNMLNASDFQKLQECAGELYEAPMFIDDTPGLSVLQLRAKARRLAIQHDIKAVFVDYLQLMSSPGAESRQQEVSEISRGIKALARELNIPVIAMSQLNRNAENRQDNRPMLADMRESGSIEQDADVVMMLHREEYYHKTDEWAAENPEKQGLAELIIAKQRNGPTGVNKLHFNAATVRFNNHHEHVNNNNYTNQTNQSDEIPPF